MTPPTHSRGPLRKARGPILGARSRYAALLREIKHKRITPRYRGLHWLSAVAVLLFLIQLFTGVLLSLYYYPEPTSAYDSARHIMADVRGGWLIRGMHAWAGELLVLTVLAHVIRQFFRRAYRRPREGEWILGVLLLLVVLAFRFTGRLLPWDHVGLATAERGLDLMGNVPVIGPIMVAWLNPGDTASLGPEALGRFFSTHVLVLPWTTLLLIVVSVWLIVRHGLRGRATS